MSNSSLLSLSKDQEGTGITMQDAALLSSGGCKWKECLDDVWLGRREGTGSYRRDQVAPSPWKSFLDGFFPPDIAVGSRESSAGRGSYVKHALCVRQGEMVVVRGKERMVSRVTRQT